MLIKKWNFQTIPPEPVASFNVILDSILDLYNIQEKREFWSESNLQSIDQTITPEIERINVVYESMVNTLATEHSKFIAKDKEIVSPEVRAHQPLQENSEPTQEMLEFIEQYNTSSDEDSKKDESTLPSMTYDKPPAMKQNRPQEQRNADTQKNPDNQNIEDLVSNKINNFLNKNNFSKTIQSQIKRYEHERSEVNKLKVELKAILQETKEDRTRIHTLKLRQKKQHMTVNLTSITSNQQIV